MDSIPTVEALSAGSLQERPSRTMPDLRADAVVFAGDHRVSVQELALRAPGEGEVIVETEASSISTGTEKLFWSGEMPFFPGMGYPLVPGYEAVGRVVWAEPGSSLVGKRVFVPGAHSFADARSLFGGASSRLVAKAEKVFETGDLRPEEALLLSLAATAYHAIAGGEPPDLIVGFGPLGRLLFRITVALGHEAPQVWEINPARQEAEGIRALTAETDDHKAYRSIYDASGSEGLLDRLIGSLGKGGTLVLAGFYPGRLDFAFAPAFQKEARLRIAAEWAPGDMADLRQLVGEGKLSLAGLVSHSRPSSEAAAAYEAAFTDHECLKMILDWRTA